MDTQPMPRLQLTGTLASDAAVRIRPIGDQGTPMQVLHLELENIGPGRHTATLEQAFPSGNPKAAHARAAQLRKGMQVSFIAPPDYLHVTFRHVEHISVLPNPNHPKGQK